MKRMVKKNYKIIVGIIIGLLISSIGVYAVSFLSSSDISYDNQSSGIEAETMQQAIDKLYERTKSYKEYIPNDNPNRNIVKAYVYNEDSDSPTYCVSGEEDSCFITTCYDNKSENACKQGTIIDYKVNDTEETIRFHVIHDDGETMTLQSQKNTVNGVKWYDGSNSNNQGPLTVLKVLEDATKGWTNVNQIEYEAGKTKFNGNEFTGCTFNNNLESDYKVYCNQNDYTLETRTANTRMITAQEAGSTGCLAIKESSCPDFMYNYLYESTKHGGSYDDVDSNNNGYWTMSALVAHDHRYAWYVYQNGILSGHDIISTNSGARAVVEINKSLE